MRTYSILFIDDEEVIRESFLKLVDWESRRFTVAGVFKNGEDAWDYLRAHGVDIIVTDINMPFLDGITLLEKLRGEQTKTRVILLTGYEYFEYAQKAVHLKAFDFLLKPVTTQRLLRAVEDAAFDIEKEEAAQEAVGRSLELAQSSFIRQLLYGKLEREKIRQEAGTCGILADGAGYMVLLGAVDAAGGKRIPEGELEEIKRSLQEKILEEKRRTEEKLGEPFELYFAVNAGSYVQVVLAAENGRLFSGEFIREFTERILEDESTECRLTLAAGKKCSCLEELPKTFERADFMLKNRHILGVGKTIRDTEALPQKAAVQQIVLPTDTFLEHIRMGMDRETEQDIKNIYQNLRYREYVSLESARMVTTELAITAFKGQLSSKDESVSYLYYLNHIQELNTLREMEAEITEFAVRIAQQRKQGGNAKKKTADQALEYLRSNYSRENLSLGDVAGYLNISVPYLAVLFRQETNQNFSTHLLKIRMEKAKELLKTTGYSVGEISEMVGYGSAQYFAVCFKKYTGSSPSGYRDQN